jgi:hypothetical protein
MLLALILTLGSLAYGQAPDCQFTQTFTTTGYGVTVANQAVANLGTQCTTWRLSYYADGMSALSIQIEGAPDASGYPGTFAAVPTTACSTTVQPPCLIDGTNPLTNANHATEAFRGYYAWIALDVTTFTSTGAGSITARMYGYKGTSSAANLLGGGGGGVAAIGCVGTPGNTVGVYRQQCQTTAGAIYACNNPANCTVAADWVTGSATKASTTVTLGPIVDGGCAETPVFNFAGILAGDTVFAGTTSTAMPASVTVAAKVVSNNVVAVDVCNLSGGSYTVSNATFTVAMSR